MLKRALVILALGGLLVFGIAHLFLMRFESGDVYARYSSLRTDPLGIKAFHDALQEAGVLEVARNYRPIEKLRPAGPVTLIYAGTPHTAWWGEEELRTVEKLAAGGSRVVLTFLPVRQTNAGKPGKEEKNAPKSAEKKEAPKNPEDGDTPAEEDETVKPAVAFKAVASRWGFEFVYLTAAASAREKAVLKADLPLEPELSWHTTLAFSALQPSWKTVYGSGGKAVVIERNFGKGSIVLAADSYFLSNEALRNERCPQLLAWLTGAPATVIFDEESHGVREDPGLAALVRKYRLRGTVSTLLVLAALFLWKNTRPLVPALSEEVSGEATVRGKDAGSGFINLLRRTVALRDLPGVCVAEWKKAFNHDGRNPKAALLEEVLALEAAKPPRERNPLAAYSAICAKISRNAPVRQLP